MLVTKKKQTCLNNQIKSLKLPEMARVIPVCIPWFLCCIKQI